MPNANIYADPTNPSQASWPFTTLYNYGSIYPIGNDSTICYFWDDVQQDGWISPARSFPPVYRDCLNSAPSVSAMVFASNDMTRLGPMLDFSQNYNPAQGINNQLYAWTSGQVVRTTSNYTRVNVGLMWGWFTLSSKWHGLWDGSALPAASTDSNKVKKVLILMGNNVNSVYTGLTYLGVTMSKDDDTTKAMCDAIKASPDNITIYTVSPSNWTTQQAISGVQTPTVNPLLAYCASKPEYYIHKSTAADTAIAIQGIADQILYDTIRLSQ